MRTHDRIEAAFEAWGRLVVRHRFAVTLTVLAIAVGVGSFLPQVRADNSTESFLRPSDPARLDYDRFLEQFGQDERLLLVIRPREIFELDFLAELRQIHREVEQEVPYVADLTSLWNARNTRGERDELVVEDLMEDWPETEADLATLRERVVSTPVYRNTIVNEALTLTGVIVEPFIYSTAGDEADDLGGFDARAAADAPAERLSEAEQNEMIDALRGIVARHAGPGLEIHLAGGPVGNRTATEALMRDVAVFLTWGSVLMAALLFWLFRRISAVLLTLVVVLLSVVVTYGAMALLGIPTSVSGTVLPVLVLCVGTCASVHVLTIVFQRLSGGESREDAIAGALGHSGLAVMMASVTTAGGLLSFVSAELAQVRNLGLAAPIGVLLTFVFSVTLLPSLLAIVPLRASKPSAEAVQRRVGAALARAGAFATARAPLVLAGTALLVAIGGLGVAQLRFSQDGMNWFPEDDPTRLATELLDAEFGGASGIEVWLDAGRENALHDPELLRRIERGVVFAEGLTEGGGEMYAGKVVSVLEVLKETHQALNGNDPAYYAIPDSRALIAQELLLFENSGSDDLEELVDSQLSMARVSLRTPMVDALLYMPFMERLDAGFREILGDGVAVQVTGLGSLFGRTFSVVNVTMARSYLIALVIITPLMVLLIGEWKRGLLSMVPNLVPIWLTLGLMGWLDVPIDNSSLLVGCVLIGLAVDDTIHFMHKFTRYLAETGDVQEAVRRTLVTTGSALLFTSLVLAGGFMVMTLSYMDNVANFGRLCAFAAVVAFLADLLVAPALMAWVGDGDRVEAGDAVRAEPAA